MSQDTEDHSYNLESGRYKVLDGEFYCPPFDRPLLELDGFRPMRPTLGEADADQQEELKDSLHRAYRRAWDEYADMITSGVGREIARLALPFGLYYAGYVSGKPWTWMHFFGLRTREGDPPESYPQWETEQVARKCMSIFQKHWPLAFAAWSEKRTQGGQ